VSGIVVPLSSLERDHYHSASEHGIIGRLTETVETGRFRRRRRNRGLWGQKTPALIQGKKGCRMAAMKPRTGDGPLEVTKEGRGIVMRVPLEGGGRLVVELTADEAAKLGDALKTAIG
jgi:hypothetical protein